MKFVIKIENNKPVDHPIAFDNFLMIFPNADYDNLPEGYAKFVRVPRPYLGPFRAVEKQSVYEWDGDVITDIWNYTEMSAEEKQQLIELRQSELPFPSWTLDTETLQFVPPVPAPNDYRRYSWNENTLNWDLLSE